MPYHPDRYGRDDEVIATFCDNIILASPSNSARVTHSELTFVSLLVVFSFSK